MSKRRQRCTKYVGPMNLPTYAHSIAGARPSVGQSFSMRGFARRA